MASVFLDGLPGAGKTTLCERLRGRVPHVQEVSARVPRRDFPGDGRTLDECLAVLRWFVAREAERAPREGVYDRSWLSHLAYARAWERHAGVPGLADAYVEVLQAAVDGGALPRPHLCVLVRSPDSLRRLEHRCAQPGRSRLADPWFQAGFRADVEAAHEAILAALPPEAALALDVDDADEAVADAWRRAAALPPLPLDLRAVRWTA